LLVLYEVSAYSLRAVQEDAILSALDLQNKFSMVLRKIGTCVPNTRIHASKTVSSAYRCEKPKLLKVVIINYVFIVEHFVPKQCFETFYW
jgi:hypothetical protein